MFWIKKNLFTICLFLILAAHAAAQDLSSQRSDHASVELLSDSDSVVAGDDLYLGIRFLIEDGWHIYWQNPGDTGLPTAVDWDLPSGFSADPIAWPIPKKFLVGELVNYGYEREVLFPIRVQTPNEVNKKSFLLKAHISWLICKELCIPGEVNVARTIEIGSSVKPSIHANIIEESRRNLPQESMPDQFGVEVDTQGHWTIDLGNQPKDSFTAEYFPHRERVISYASPQNLIVTDNGVFLKGSVSDDYHQADKMFRGTIVISNASTGEIEAYDFERMPTEGVKPKSATLEFDGQTVDSVWIAIIFAFIGGVILNLMPCVLPVIALKVMSLVGQSKTVTHRVRDAGLYSLGVIGTFCSIGVLLLVLRSAGEQIGWGYQLQSPAVVLILILLFFLLALNMSGLFEIGTGFQKVGNSEQGSGRIASFLSGVLATAIATPCTAPFMGAALGFSMTQSNFVSFFTFFALGVGMASPFLLVALRPGLGRRIPAPGAWMGTFKNLLSIPLYLTVVWLVWVVGQQTDIHTSSKILLILVFVGLCVWSYGRLQFRKTQLRKTWSVFTFVVFVLCVAGISNVLNSLEKEDSLTDDQIQWQEWSIDKVMAAQSNGHPVFIDFTAAWCLTCQVNKQLVLTDDRVLRAFSENDVILFKADWTNRDKQISRAIESYGRSGVPVYVYYTPNDELPIVLPEILTINAMLRLLQP